MTFSGEGNSVGAFTHTITLIGASTDDRETVEARVDSGAIFTAIPSPILERRLVPAEALRTWGGAGV